MSYFEDRFVSPHAVIRTVRFVLEFKVDQRLPRLVSRLRRMSWSWGWKVAVVWFVFLVKPNRTACRALDRKQVLMFDRGAVTNFDFGKCPGRRNNLAHWTGQEEIGIMKICSSPNGGEWWSFNDPFIVAKQCFKSTDLKSSLSTNYLEYILLE